MYIPTDFLCVFLNKYLAPEILNYEPITTATDLWYVYKVFSSYPASSIM